MNAKMNIKKVTLIFYFACLIMIALPLVSLILNGEQNIQIVGNEVLTSAVMVSLKTTAIMMTIILLIGTPAAYAVARVNFRGKSILNIILDIPLVLPPAVTGLLLLLTFGRKGLVGASLSGFNIQFPFTMAAVVIAQIFVGLPIYIKTTAEGIKKVDEKLELTAMTLGDSKLQAFMKITLPLAKGSIMTGSIMAWARGLAEFGATMLFAGNLPGVTQTLPLAIYSAMEVDMGVALAIARVMVVISMALLILLHMISQKLSHNKSEEV